MVVLVIERPTDISSHRVGIYSRLSLASRASALSRHDLPFQYTSSVSSPLTSAKNAHSVIIHPEIPSQHSAQYDPLTTELTSPQANLHGHRNFCSNKCEEASERAIRRYSRR